MDICSDVLLSRAHRNVVPIAPEIYSINSFNYVNMIFWFGKSDEASC